MSAGREISAFLDTDVVISSLLSSKGASWLVINHPGKITLCLTEISLEEIIKVVHRLDISATRLSLLKPRFNITKTTARFSELVVKCNGYVNDQNDAKILAGAMFTKSRFLLTYNLKDYKVREIKNELGIIVLTPGSFLQYLRSLS